MRPLFRRWTPLSIFNRPMVPFGLLLGLGVAIVIGAAVLWIVSTGGGA